METPEDRSARWGQAFWDAYRTCSPLVPLELDLTGEFGGLDKELRAAIENGAQAAGSEATHAFAKNEILANAGPEWDKPLVPETIAIEYVRHLEAKLAMVEYDRARTSQAAFATGMQAARDLAAKQENKPATDPNHEPGLSECGCRDCDPRRHEQEHAEALPAIWEALADNLDATSRTAESLDDKPHWARLRGRVAQARYCAGQLRRALSAQSDAATELDNARAEISRLRELLNEAHIADPEDRHPDDCRCQFCREDIREAQAQDDEDEFGTGADEDEGHDGSEGIGTSVAAWTGHGPGCGCEDCEGMRRDAAADTWPDRGAAENAL